MLRTGHVVWVLLYIVAFAKSVQWFCVVFRARRQHVAQILLSSLLLLAMASAGFHSMAVGFSSLHHQESSHMTGRLVVGFGFVYFLVLYLSTKGKDGGELGRDTD